MVHYRYFCDDCGKSTPQPIEACEHCGSTDITHAPAYACVEHDDVRDAKRLEEIRAVRP